MCRREQKDVPLAPDMRASNVGPLLAVLVVLLIGSGAYFGYGRWMKSHASGIGQSCDQRYGCVPDADCMSRDGTASKDTQCHRRCASSTTCDATEKCWSGHCVPAVPLGGPCTDDSVCRDSQCITLAGRSAMCLRSCEADDACPPGASCQHPGDAGVPLVSDRSYCVPAE